MCRFPSPPEMLEFQIEAQMEEGEKKKRFLRHHSVNLQCYKELDYLEIKHVM